MSRRKSRTIPAAQATPPKRSPRAPRAAKGTNGSHPKTLPAIVETPPGLLLRIGERLAEPVPDLKAAQVVYIAAREAAGEGTSTFEDGIVYANGTEVARISYNGRAWSSADGKELSPSPETDPAVAAALGESEPLAPAFTIDLPVKYLKAALAIAPKDDTRYYMNGVYFHREGTELRIVASDGHRMLVISTAHEGELPWAEAGLIVPRIELDRVMKYVGKDETVKLSYGVNHPRVILSDVSGDATFRVAPIDGKFPEYQRVMQSAGDVLHAERMPTDTAVLNPAYLKAAGAIAAQLESEGIFPFIGGKPGDPCVFTFSGEAGALLYIMAMQSSTPALSAKTLQMIGESGLAGTLAALKAHETRCRNALKANGKSAEDKKALIEKADAYKARAEEIRASLTVKLEGPKPATVETDDQEEATA